MGLFRDEARQRLDQMDTELLAIESGDADAESVGSLFRHAHTIKGAAGMLGFDDIRALAHAAEDILAQVRETGVFPPDLAAPLLRATAALRAMVSGSPEPIGDLLSDLAASRAALAGEGDPGENEPEQASPPEPASPQQTSSPPGPHVPSAPAAQSRAPGPAGPCAGRDGRSGARAAGTGGEARPSARRHRRDHAVPEPPDARTWPGAAAVPGRLRHARSRRAPARRAQGHGVRDADCSRSRRSPARCRVPSAISHVPRARRSSSSSPEPTPNSTGSSWRACRSRSRTCCGTRSCTASRPRPIVSAQPSPPADGWSCARCRAAAW